MKKQTILMLVVLGLVPILAFTQVQVGSDILSPGDGDILGLSMNEDGTRVAIGTPLYDGVRGRLRVYSYNGSEWTQTGQDIIGETAVDFTGFSADLDAPGDRLIVGSPNHNTNQGRVVVYDYDGANWVQVGSTILGANPSDCGRNVSISNSGTVIAVGESGTNNGTGRVRVFDFDGSDWVLKGQELNGQEGGSAFGFSLDLNDTGDRIAIGSPNFEEGSIRMFEFDGNAWNPLGQEISGDAMVDRFGEYVSISGSGYRIAVGAPGSDIAGENSGLVRVFDYNGQQWQVVGQDIFGPSGISWFGLVSLTNSGNALAATKGGANDAFIYEFENNGWVQKAQLSDAASVAFNGNATRFAAGGFELTRIYDLSGVLGTEQMEHQQGVTLYPNPANDLIYITGNDDSLDFEIYSMQGSMVAKGKADEEINVSHLPSGIYIVKLFDRKAASYHRVLIQ
ncbi:MAG: T9SS type A sorting domain-containing protein [Flavobacteriaceae bacterium]|nr:T9SS type A sorting domain-containing protein [Flavobacteriaceae bacterium]